MFVPVLGSILFSIYTRPLGRIIRQHNVAFLFYGDDLLIYLPPVASGPTLFSSTDPPVLHSLLNLSKFLAN